MKSMARARGICVVVVLRSTSQQVGECLFDLSATRGRDVFDTRGNEHNNFGRVTRNRFGEEVLGRIEAKLLSSVAIQRRPDVVNEMQSSSNQSAKKSLSELI